MQICIQTGFLAEFSPRAGSEISHFGVQSSRMPVCVPLDRSLDGDAMPWELCAGDKGS